MRSAVPDTGVAGGDAASAVDDTDPARSDRSPGHRDGRPIATTVALIAVVAAAAGLAVALHRNGHTLGDDFALYLRQARSIFDGDVAQVVADNRFTVVNSEAVFSPIAYPWGWPLLLSPFVHVWGLDYDRLKLLEVAAFCIWLVLVHGIVRRRAGRLLALAIVAVVGTAPLLLAHTDQLLSEYPHAAMVAAFIWWLDRTTARRPLIAASTRSLVVLGLLAAAAYNIRREAVVLAAVVLVVQAAELLADRRERQSTVSRASPRASERQSTVSRASPRASERGSTAIPWRTVATPYAAFLGSIIGFQLLIPSMLMPDSGDSPSYIGERMGDYATVLTQQLGLGGHARLGAIVLVLAGIGMVVGCIRRPQLDIGLTAVTVLTALTVSTHFQMVGRYYFQILPWVLYFAATAIVAGVQWLMRGRERRVGDAVAAAVAVVPLLYVVALHTVVLPDDVSAAGDSDRSGNQPLGPTDAAITPIYDAVEELTEPTAVVAYYRARTMTLLTDRRTIQTTDIDRVMQRADYYAQMRFLIYFQPYITPNEAAELGLVEVWSDNRWILWRVPDLGDAPKAAG